MNKDIEENMLLSIITMLSLFVLYAPLPDFPKGAMHNELVVSKVNQMFAWLFRWLIMFWMKKTSSFAESVSSETQILC